MARRRRTRSDGTPIDTPVDGTPLDAADATTTGSSVLGLVRRLKDQIVEKDRILSERTRELKEARRRIENIVASMADAVVVLDGQGVIESVNQATLDLLGWTRADLVGQPASVLWADPAHGALFEGERFQDLVRSGQSQSAELAWRTCKGERIAVSWNAAPLRDGDRLHGLVGIARDVRAEKRIEEEKLKTVRALAASVAHEIRNPLGAIQNSVALLRRDLALSGDDRTLMDIVFSETERIASIVSQFLAFARPSKPNVAPGDAGALLRDVLRLAEKDERARGTDVLLVVDPDVPQAVFDEDRVKQVVWNLVSNALDAAPGGRVAIRARRGPDGGIEVRVADTGRGFDPAELARAFEPFRTTKARGTGLGLAISKSIIEAHGGAIRIESAPGGGTTVTFTLPALPAG